MENTMNTETVSVTVPTKIRVFASIEAAKLPAGYVTEKIRNLDQKERTSKIRGALKACGVVMAGSRVNGSPVKGGVSVKSATGSMCYWTHVEFARVDHAEGMDFTNHNRMECPVCRLNIETDRKLSALVLQAFPDLDDRSDSMTDHFDFMFTVSAV